MRDANGREWQNSDEVIDSPVPRNERANREDNHGDDSEHGETHGPFEGLENLRHFDKEVTEFRFLARSTPGHVDAEHVRHQCLRDVQGETAEEDSEHEGPLEVFEQGAKPAARADSVAHSCQSKVAESVKDNDNGEPDFPAVDVILVEITVEPADSEVICDCEDPGSANGVVGANVGNDRDFAGHADVGKQELAE